MIDKKFDITIIGAGVVGLAIAEELSDKYTNVVLLERKESYGRDTSSRAGEIIHSGLYYPSDFFKGKFCRLGNDALYEICAERGISHRRVGKIILATGNQQIERLTRIKHQGEESGVDDLSMLSRKQIHALEPQVKAQQGLLSPSTGIIDIHGLMRSFVLKAERNGATIVYQSNVTDINFDGVHYVVEINNGGYYFKTRVLINSAGLFSDQVAAMLDIDIDKQGYRIHYSKGTFFSASPAPKLEHLVWPMNPPKDKRVNGVRGIHTDIDLAGSVKFGPHWEYVTELNYTVDENRRDLFHQSVSTYLPSINFESITPAMSGIRPQLQGPNGRYRDFVIKDEADLGYPGMINLIGIECPGLTASIPIARYVNTLVKGYLE